MADLQLEGTTSGGHPFLVAARRGDVAEIRRLLAAGVSPDLAIASFIQPHINGWSYTMPQRSALCFASGGIAYHDERTDTAIHPTQDKQEAIVVALLNAGASPNPPGTPVLHRAATQGYARIVKLLLEAGSNPRTPNHMGTTPLHYAAMQCPQCVQLLLAAGAEVDAKCQNRDRQTGNFTGPYWTPLDRAIHTGRVNDRPRVHRVYPLLLRAGAAFPRHSWDAVPAHLRRQRFSYLTQIQRAGSFAAYEKKHTDALVAIFVPKFPHLNADVVRHIVKLWAHCGFY